MDTVSCEKRSEIMSKIRSKGTVPETLAVAAVRRRLRGSGRRVMTNVSSLPGKPDIVVGNVAVFVDGAFFHGGCRRCWRRVSTPKSNTDFWVEKRESNRRRDAAQRRRLRAGGWTVIKVCECVARRPDLMADAAENIARKAGA